MSNIKISINKLVVKSTITISLFCFISVGKPIPSNTNADTTSVFVKDIDGNIYTTVKIGNQTWLVENLRTTKYNDGSPIPKDTSRESWKNATTPKYCYFNNMNNADSIKKFGALYNWYVIKTGKLAPTGWHVPDTSDWSILENYLIENNYNWDETTKRNKISKSLASKTDWKTYKRPGTIGNNLESNNKSGFSALPSGNRNSLGVFFGIGANIYWWSSTESVLNIPYAYTRFIEFSHDYLNGADYPESCGFSVKLIKD